MGQKRLFAAGAEGVERLSEEFLAGTGLPIDQGSGVILCDGADYGFQMVHFLILGDDVIQNGVGHGVRRGTFRVLHLQDLGNIHRPLDLAGVIQDGVCGGDHGNQKISVCEHLLLSHRDLPSAEGLHHRTVLLGQFGVDREQVIANHIATEVLRQFAEGTTRLIVLHDAGLVDHQHPLHGIAVQMHQMGDLLEIFFHTVPPLHAAALLSSLQKDRIMFSFSLAGMERKGNEILGAPPRIGRLYGVECYYINISQIRIPLTVSPNFF